METEASIFIGLHTDTFYHYKKNCENFINALLKEGIEIKGKVTENDVKEIRILGYILGRGQVRPDYDRLRPS